MDGRVLELSLAAVAERKRKIDEQLALLRRDPSPATIGVRSGSGFLAIDRARQGLISTTSTDRPIAAPAPLPPPLLLKPEASTVPDPLERARALLERSTVVQAETAQLVAARDAIKERIAAELAEAQQASDQLALTGTQLEGSRAELLARQAEVELLRSQYGQLVELTSELLRVVDPTWNDLVGDVLTAHDQTLGAGGTSMSASAFAGLLERLETVLAQERTV
jgi:multidrug efflux pump subunit AcrA (membrane-fusion protein)